MWGVWADGKYSVGKHHTFPSFAKLIYWQIAGLQKNFHMIWSNTIPNIITREPLGRTGTSLPFSLYITTTFITATSITFTNAIKFWKGFKNYLLPVGLILLDVGFASAEGRLSLMVNFGISLPSVLLASFKMWYSEHI